MTEETEVQTPAPKPEAPPLVLLSAIWCVAAATELLLSLIIPGGILRDPVLSLPARFSLFLLELFFLGLTVTALAGPFVLLTRLRKKPWYDKPAIRMTAPRVLLLGSFAVLFLYFSSWATFWSMGTFLDSEGSRFWATNFKLFMLHVVDNQLALFVMVPILVMLVAVLLCEVLPRWLARRPAGFQRRLIRGTGIALGASLLLALVGELTAGRADASVMDAGTGAPYRQSVYYGHARDYRTGPSLRAFADARDMLFGGDAELLADTDIAIHREPRIAPSDFRHQPENPWNVVVLLVESLRPDQLKAFGCRRDVMPNLNRVAEESLLFSNVYAQASHSDYSDICPLTSMYPLRHPKRYIYVKNPQYPRALLYDILKSCGYRTSIFSSQNESWGGMSHYLDSGTLDVFLHSETYGGETYVPHEDTGFARWVKTTKRSGKIDDRFTVAEAVKWIGNGDARPFFMYMNLQNSHVPFPRPSDFPARFGPEKIDFRIAFGNFPRDKIEVVKDIYADSLAYVDHQIGKLIDALKKQGKWDRTIFVVSGDTGQAFYEHGFAGHAREVYNEVMRVPLIIRAPGAGARMDHRLAQHIDVPPTVFSLLGLPSYPGFQGRSLLDETPNDRRSVYLLCQTPLARQYALVRGDWKLIYDDRKRTYLLYDLRQDPGETADQSDLHPEVVRRMRGRLHTWMKAQIEYYMDYDRSGLEFPPRLQD